MLLEVACFNLEDALLAERAGADRIEFCEDYSVGGITPSEKDISAARSQIKIPLFIMIRPAAANFVYTLEELEEMKSKIEFCKKIKCDGVVFGILDLKNEINTEQCKMLVEHARSMECTFHRAFDETANLNESLEKIIDCGFTRVLTSGGKGKAADNLNSLKKLIKATADRISIMPGGGVRAENVANIVLNTGCKEIHTAAINPHSGRLVVSEIKQIKKLIAE